MHTYIYTPGHCDGVSLSLDEQKPNVPTQAVLQTCKPVMSSNRNITADNWFSSIEVADKLLKRKLTFVGTVKKIKK